MEKLWEVYFTNGQTYRTFASCADEACDLAEGLLDDMEEDWVEVDEAFELEKSLFDIYYSDGQNAQYLAYSFDEATEFALGLLEEHDPGTELMLVSMVI